MWATVLAVVAIVYFGVLSIWGIVQVYRLGAEPMRFSVRHLLTFTTALAVYLGAIAALVRW
jgi:hypothetical protein